MPLTEKDRLTRAREIALGAGRILLDHLGGLRTADIAFKGSRDLCTIADRAAEEFVLTELRSSFPGEAIFAEETGTANAASGEADASWLWIIDPLDGTTNFVHSFPHFSVAIGLWRDGKPVLGVVHAPCTGETFSGIVGQGAWLGDEGITVSGVTSISASLLGTGFPYNRSEPGADTNLARFSPALLACQGIRRTGSVCLDLSYLACGRLDAFWEIGLGKYDIAAGAAIVLGAGGKNTDLAGGDDYLDLGRLAASNVHLHAELLALVGDDIPVE